MDLGRTTWLYFFPFISLFRKAYLTLTQNIETLNSASLSIAKLNKTLWECVFRRGRITGMILWTCLIAAKELSSYFTREDKSFTPLVCWTTQLIQYVPIHNKNSVISRQCLKICTSSMQTCLEPNCNIGHKWLQPGEKCLSQLYWYWQMCFHTHHIVQCIPVTNKGK